MKVIFFGTPDFVLPVLNSLSKNHTIVAVVTTADQAVGRKKILTPSPVKQYAIDTNIQSIFTPEKFNDKVTSDLAALQPDIFIVAAYGKIIPEKILAIPKYGALNIHPSLLPKYRGPSPIQTALRNGDHETGITIIKMDAKMDHGPIIAQEVFPLTQEDTFASLHIRMFERSAMLLQNILLDFMSGKLNPIPQEEEKATYCSMITKNDGFFDIKNPPPPAVLDRMIRAFYPWPTAWTKMQLVESDPSSNKIMKFYPLGKVQIEGGKTTNIKDLLNGHPQLHEAFKNLGLRTKD